MSQTIAGAGRSRHARTGCFMWRSIARSYPDDEGPVASAHTRWLVLGIEQTRGWPESAMEGPSLRRSTMNEFIASHNVLLLSISLVWVVAFVFFCIEMDQLDLALKARLGVLQAPHHNPGAWAGAAGVSVT